MAKRSKADKAEERRRRILLGHLQNATNNSIVDKIIAGEELTPTEATQAARMPRAIPKMVKLKKSGIYDRIMALGPLSSGRPPRIDRQIVKPHISQPAQTREERLAFYSSPEWRKLRYRAILRSKGCCEACGRSRKDGIVLHVDHVKPISKYPHLKLVLSNLQVLCEDCNMGKGAWDETDWRDPFVETEPEPDPDPRYGDLRLISNDGRSIA